MQKQWLITLQGLPSAGRNWDKSVSAAVLTGEQAQDGVIPELVKDVTWSATIERKGGVFHLQGHWDTAIRRHCSRCNNAFDWQLAMDMERDWQLGEEQKSGARSDDRDTEAMEGICEYLPAPGELNLLDVLREDLWLAWKADVICSETCKGLCLGCGCNLNQEDCSCVQDRSDHPFAALRGLKLD